MRPLVSSFFAAGLVTAVTIAAAGQPALAPDPLQPASAGGLETVHQALAKLRTHARLLVIGAHPDDEDNALMAWVARDQGGEAAYLSLSRGEGGQNLIGPELGERLGLIRTGELMAARHAEGARQYFTRAYDFGYTRSLEETLERWPREVLLEDAIRAIRRFKPQVIVAVFPADARAGHGQHQASAVIAREAYEKAGDPAVFPELGLPAWSPSAFYRRAWSVEDATVTYLLSKLDLLSGRSVAQLAAESRSQHRSQDMGRSQRLGVFRAGLHWIDGGSGEEARGPFDGAGGPLSEMVAGFSQGAKRRSLELRLSGAATLAHEALGLPAHDEEGLVEAFGLILVELRGAREMLGDSYGEIAVRDLIDEKIAVAEVGLAAAAGVVVDAVADRERVTMGESLEVAVEFFRAGQTPAEVQRVRLHSPVGWIVQAGEEVKDEQRPGGPWGVHSWRFAVRVPTTGGGSGPYYLDLPRTGDLYDWSEVPEEVRGEPHLPNMTARFELTIGGTPVTLEREVVHRYADQAIGEVRRPLRSVPPVEVSIVPGLSLWSRASGQDQVTFGISAISNLDRELSGHLELKLPDGLEPFERRAVTLGPGARESAVYLSFEGELPDGLHEVAAAFVTRDGRRFGASVAVVDYSHVRPRPYKEAAKARIRALSIELPELSRVGYVRGASDRVPELLEKVGVPIELVDLGSKSGEDLVRFDAIVIGSRAYEIDTGLRANNAALMEYVENGGLLIVQYQQYQFVRGGFAPLRLEIERPHGRITDESSPVRVLEPDHPVFNRPNRIEDSDWEGWVQERGLYFAGEWDEGYKPLLAMQDPGDQPEQRGGLLIAPVGEGTYVYTGLSFFRELPAGVPGAFRLFANLLALGDDDAP